MMAIEERERRTTTRRSSARGSSSKEVQEEEKEQQDDEPSAASLLRCPFSGSEFLLPLSSQNHDPDKASTSPSTHLTIRNGDDETAVPPSVFEHTISRSCRSGAPDRLEVLPGGAGNEEKLKKEAPPSEISPPSLRLPSCPHFTSSPASPYYGITGDQMMEVFPYHIGVDRNLLITQVGERLQSHYDFNLVGRRVDSLFCIKEPDECPWNWERVRLCKDSKFRLEPVEVHGGAAAEDGTTAAGGGGDRRNASSKIPFGLYGGLLLNSAPTRARCVGAAAAPAGSGAAVSSSCCLPTSPFYALFLVQPNVQSVAAMAKHGLTWSNFGNFSSQPQLILLAEHLKSETAQAIKSKKEAVTSQQSLEMKRMFVRYVSHEIRTPLNTVYLGLELIGSMQPTTPSEEPSAQGGGAPTHDDLVGIFAMTAEIKESCDVAIKILDDLLLYEKLEGGILNLSTRTEPALQVVYDSVRMFNVQAKAVDVDIEFTYDTMHFAYDEINSPMAFVSVDRPKISQVLRNLVSNAIKFTSGSKRADILCREGDDESGGETVSIRSKVIVHCSIVTEENPPSSLQAESDDDPMANRSSTKSTPTGRLLRTAPCSSVRKFVRIEVVDQGPGISPENQELLFGQIIQFDPNKLQGGNGSGLGLYISKGIMDLHGGSIGVFSEGEGRGSCFWIDIPLLGGSMHPSPLASLNAAGGDSGRRSIDITADAKSARPSPSTAQVVEDLIAPSSSSSPRGKFLDEWHNHDSAAIASVRRRMFVESSSTNVAATASGAASRRSSRVGAPGLFGSRRSSIERPGVSRKKGKPHPVFNYSKPFKRFVPTNGALLLSKESAAEDFEGNNSSNDDSNEQVEKMKTMKSSVGVEHPIMAAAKGGGESSYADSLRIVKTAALSPTSASADFSVTALEEVNAGVAGRRVDVSAAGASTTAALKKEATVAAITSDRVSSESGATSNAVTLTLSSTLQQGLGGEPQQNEERRGSTVKSILGTDPVPDSFITTVVNFRVLVVDDSEANRKMVTRFLKMTKISKDVWQAVDGEDALRQVTRMMNLEEKQFDVVLMDFVMPVMDGPTATKAMRDAGYKGVIIGVTGNVLPEEVEVFKSHGADVVMGKPLDMKQLKYTLMKHIVTSPTGSAVPRKSSSVSSHPRDDPLAHPVSPPLDPQEPPAAVLRNTVQASGGANDPPRCNEQGRKEGQELLPPASSSTPSESSASQKLQVTSGEEVEAAGATEWSIKSTPGGHASDYFSSVPVRLPHCVPPLPLTNSAANIVTNEADLIGRRDNDGLGDFGEEQRDDKNVGSANDRPRRSADPSCSSEKVPKFVSPHKIPSAADAPPAVAPDKQSPREDEQSDDSPRSDGAGAGERCISGTKQFLQCAFNCPGCKRGYVLHLGDRDGGDFEVDSSRGKRVVAHFSSAADMFSKMAIEENKMFSLKNASSSLTAHAPLTRRTSSTTKSIAFKQVDGNITYYSAPLTPASLDITGAGAPNLSLASAAPGVASIAIQKTARSTSVPRRLDHLKGEEAEEQPLRRLPLLLADRRQPDQHSLHGAAATNDQQQARGGQGLGEKTSRGGGSIWRRFFFRGGKDKNKQQRSISQRSRPRSERARIIPEQQQQQQEGEIRAVRSHGGSFYVGSNSTRSVGGLFHWDNHRHRRSSHHSPSDNGGGGGSGGGGAPPGAADGHHSEQSYSSGNTSGGDEIYRTLLATHFGGLGAVVLGGRPAAPPPPRAAASSASRIVPAAAATASSIMGGAAGATAAARVAPASSNLASRSSSFRMFTGRRSSREPPPYVNMVPQQGAFEGSSDLATAAAPPGSGGIGSPSSRFQLQPATTEGSPPPAASVRSSRGGSLTGNDEGHQQAERDTLQQLADRKASALTRNREHSRSWFNFF